MAERIKPDMIKRISSDITDEIIKDEALKAIRACFQCGTCSGGCPSGRRTPLRTRQVIRKAILGIEAVLKEEDLWLCSTCYTCYERCPRGVPTTDIIIKLRNMATQKGFILTPHRNLTHILIQTGHGVPIGGTDNNWTKLRVSYGLEPLPPTVHSFPQAVKEIQVLIEDLNFDKLVGYPPESKPAEQKPAEAKTPEVKTNEVKSSETKPTNQKKE